MEHKVAKLAEYACAKGLWENVRVVLARQNQFAMDALVRVGALRMPDEEDYVSIVRHSAEMPVIPKPLVFARAETKKGEAPAPKEAPAKKEALAKKEADVPSVHVFVDGKGVSIVHDAPAKGEGAQVPRHFAGLGCFINDKWIPLVPDAPAKKEESIPAPVASEKEKSAPEETPAKKEATVAVPSHRTFINGHEIPIVRDVPAKKEEAPAKVEGVRADPKEDFLANYMAGAEARARMSGASVVPDAQSAPAKKEEAAPASHQSPLSANRGNPTDYEVLVRLAHGMDSIPDPAKEVPVKKEEPVPTATIRPVSVSGDAEDAGIVARYLRDLLLYQARAHVDAGKTEADRRLDALFGGASDDVVARHFYETRPAPAKTEGEEGARGGTARYGVHFEIPNAAPAKEIPSHKPKE